ncbi:phosphoribosyl-ATP pyrophosphohydrolase [Cronobacter sakazakii]|uniref:Phosphoribosyl-ATP pyrophosphohydrolase n=1 Tax=Cronobacter malonaticus TaxID=413503 RepID=A0ABX5K4Z0_9ENTR|nr:phosphoribosyl-ATP pyrophosphohydrolase [Cronobacter malonaticus]ELQ3583142.1 phosphoribosyl-ATP pyrophosphohydrolase [Cronobacter sakazakii]ELY4343836.1 phosphoribosyl-ATP pyrophosphohydrolase [Cronobacter sakazakii]ELY4567640.1 phosphoribosyl-ATP pyrophosphohydrolase [Cronobacter sakazakii]ELY4731518.1 phosphoribosyl-ATP pyrophosphohydrolase [Cronobacter sakazakii]ELY4772967.1 phosphoribosyl-ATP pyrophosphohydrolase [Cronobacter sakazakii]
MTFTNLTDHLKLAADKLVGFKPEPYELNPGYAMATESIYKMVDQFHELFQHPRRAMPEPSLLRLRAKLIHEEAVTEGIPAARNGNMTALLDAMADFLYVGIGSMVAIKGGISTGMSYYTQEQSVDRFFETIMVPGNTVFDDMAIPFREAEEAVDMLNALADRLEKTKVSDAELIQALCRVMNKIYVACMMTYRLADFLGIDVVELVAEIHRSNMTKLWPADAEERRVAVENCKYDKNDLGFRHADGTEMMIGFRLSDGKILKSPTYSDVDLTPFVEKAKTSALYEVVKNHL